MKIYHNPRCSKSRQTLKLIEQAGQKVEVIEYLKETPDVDKLKEIINLLGIRPKELIRNKEAEFKPFKGKQLSDDEYIDLMVSHPRLIERPIVIQGNKAIIGRPPEKVLDIL